MPELRVLKIITGFAAWTTIPAFLSFVIADQIFTRKYGGGLHDGLLDRPALFEWLLVWRNWSLVTCLATGLISLRKCRSLLGFSLALTYFYFSVRAY